MSWYLTHSFMLINWTSVPSSNYIAQTKNCQITKILNSVLNLVKNDFYQFLLILVILFHFLLNFQASSFTGNTASSRILLFTIYALGLIGFSAYSGKLIAFLTYKTLQMPFDSPEGLLADGSYLVGTISGSATFTNLQVYISYLFIIIGH